MEELVLSEDGKTLISCSNNISGHLVIPDGIEKIECWAFAGCTGLTTIKIPNGVTKIGSRAFEDCTGLTFVEIPDSVTNIDYEAFFGCTAISQPLYNKRFFVKMPSAYKDKFIIPDGIETICGYAFQGCSDLTDVVIPDSVTIIGISAFDGCCNLSRLTIPDSVTEIHRFAFYQCTSITRPLYNKWIFAKLPSAHNGAFVIPDGVETVCEDAFQGCSDLTDVVIPDSVTIISESLFYGCTGLTSVVIPNSVTKIGKFAFHGCTGLTFVEMPDSVTDIDYEAFLGCTAISQPLYNKQFFIKLPSAHNGRFIIPDGIETIYDAAFQGCSNLTDIVIPDSVTVISDSAFEGCTGLSSIEIPASVNYIAEYSLSNIGPQLHISVDLKNPKYLSSEGSLYSKDKSILYHYCEKEIDEFTIPSTVTTIASCAFEWSYLETMVIGNSVTVIKEYAFFCTHIEKVYISDTIKMIGSASFASCEIKEIHIRHAHPEQIKVEEYAFGKTAENCTLFVPVGTDYAYRNHPVFGKFKDVKVEE